jgi:hypothetical protein
LARKTRATDIKLLGFQSYFVSCTQRATYLCFTFAQIVMWQRVLFPKAMVKDCIALEVTQRHVGIAVRQLAILFEIEVKPHLLYI